MNRIDRVSAILIQLQSKRVVTAKEIAQRFNISIRTVYRDIRTLEEAGIPIGSEAGKGYYLVDGYLLPPVMFTPAEVGSLITAGKVLHGYGDESFLMDFDSAMYKIKSILKYGDKNYAQELENSINVYSTAGQKNSFVNNVIATIQTAICNKKVISIQYLASGRQEPENRMIEPVSMGFYEQNWYLVAFCRLRNEYRNFRVDRIKSICLEEKEFCQRHDDSVEQILKQMLSYKQLHKVILKVEKGETYNSLKNRYSLGFIEETDLGNEMEMTLQTDSLDILGKQLMEYISGIEIIEPEELRCIIHEYLTQIIERCNKLICSQ
ncbi:MAG: helix-turn-helix transcriptional regulator [Eubacteriales bacterium]